MKCNQDSINTKEDSTIKSKELKSGSNVDLWDLGSRNVTRDFGGITLISFGPWMNMVMILITCLLWSAPVRAEIVTASFYGAGESLNERTASGERFNPRAQTCAHPTKKLGTLLKVTNPKNGIWYLCKVNDLGPNPRLKRGLDMTPKGVELLKLDKKKGLYRVKVQEVSK